MRRSRRHAGWMSRAAIAAASGAMLTIIVAWLPFLRRPTIMGTASQSCIAQLDGRRFTHHYGFTARIGESNFSEALFVRDMIDDPRPPADGPPSYPWWSGLESPEAAMRALPGSVAACRQFSRSVTAGGWPLRALRMTGSEHRDEAWTIRSKRSGFIVVDGPGWLLSMLGASALTVPFDPIWTGFAVDTLAFGAPLFGALALLRWHRRRRRARRGRCPECGYGPLEAAACPECGSMRR